MIAVLVSPMRVFREAMSQPPNWPRAVVPVLLGAVLVTATGVVALVRGYAVMERAFAALGVDAIPVGVLVGIAVFSVLMGMTVAFWLSTGGLLAVDLMFVGSGRARRLVEFSAWAYWPQVLWGVIGFAATLMFYSPAPFDLPVVGGQVEVERAVADYLASEQGTPFMLTFRLFGAYFGLWFTALQACALRVVSGVSVRGAFAAGGVLGLVFVVVPWAVQRF